MISKSKLIVGLLSSLIFHPSIFAEEVDLVLDMNKDGKQDVFYEYYPEKYYELIDRNFDGAVDLSNAYEKTGNIISSRLDDDYDGKMETFIFYEFGLAKVSYVDSPLDGKPDIMYLYKDDVLMSSEHYSFLENSNQVEVESISYKYGYPNLDQIKTHNISVAEYKQRTLIFSKAIRNK